MEHDKEDQLDEFRQVVKRASNASLVHDLQRAIHQELRQILAEEVLRRLEAIDGTN